MKETIKIIEKIIAEYVCYYLKEEEVEAIENLLKAYKELKEKYNYEKNRARTELDTVYINARYDEKDKWISKVKEKIEEYHKEIDKLYNKKLWNEPVDTIRKNRLVNYINVLQELLKEE